MVKPIIGSVLFLLMSVNIANAAEFIEVGGKKFSVGDKYQLSHGAMSDKMLSVVTRADCQTNGTGLIVLKMPDDKLYELEFSPWAANCGGPNSSAANLSASSRE